MTERDQLQTFTKRILEPRKFIQVLMGPRHVGKIIALEVKSNDSENNRGLEIFKNKFKPDKLYLISNRGLSWQDLLKINPVELF